MGTAGIRIGATRPASRWRAIAVAVVAVLAVTLGFERVGVGEGGAHVGEDLPQDRQRHLPPGA